MKSMKESKGNLTLNRPFLHSERVWAAKGKELHVTGISDVEIMVGAIACDHEEHGGYEGKSMSRQGFSSCSSW
jgi:hypothetical protein